MISINLVDRTVSGRLAFDNFAWRKYLVYLDLNKGI